MSVASEIASLGAELPGDVRLVAVSKFHTPDLIMEAYEAGQRCFAESRPQELAKKVAELPKDIEWHFIGHLQSNKIKLVVPHVALIHSVGSVKLLREIDSYGARSGIVSNVLLEMHIAEEESKQGFTESGLDDLLRMLREEPLRNVRVCGLMGMATLTDDKEQIRSEFRTIRKIFERVKEEHPELQEFRELSIGMTDDYRIAIEEGSTCVRIGTRIFGPRQY